MTVDLKKDYKTDFNKTLVDPTGFIKREVRVKGSKLELPKMMELR